MGATASRLRRRSAEQALTSIEAAEAYLDSEEDHDFVLELRATWRDLSQWSAAPPSPVKKVRAAAAHAKALLRAVGSKSQLGRALQTFIYQCEHRDPGSVEYRRRLSTEPEDTRFALVLANHAFTLSRRTSRDRVVSGRLAAVIAKAEGVKKPGARRKMATDDSVGAEIRAWEAAMARAIKVVARWRSDEL